MQTFFPRLASGEYDDDAGIGDPQDQEGTKREYNFPKGQGDKENHTMSQEQEGEEAEIEQDDSEMDVEADIDEESEIDEEAGIDEDAEIDEEDYVNSGDLEADQAAREQQFTKADDYEPENKEM